MACKYILYSRKSQEDEQRQILSIQSQIDELTQYANNNSLNIVNSLSESHSASKQGRPVFTELITKIELGEANALLVWKFDRISRNEIDTARIIKLFRDGALEEIRTPFDTYRKGDNVLLLYIYFGMADEYSRALSANVKRGLRTKYRLGQYPSRAPFGYRNYLRDNQRNIEPDDNASYVNMIFEWYASGDYSLSQIRTKLNAELMITSKLGKKFSKSEIQKILCNRTYYGVFERSGELFQGTFTPIITKDLYDKVQETLHNKSRPRPKKLFHTYKLLLSCGECHSMLTGETKHKYYPKTKNHAYYTYYSCTKKNGVCSQKPIKESLFEEQLFTAIDGTNFDKEQWDIAKDLLILDLDKQRRKEHELIQLYQKQIARIDIKLNSILELRASTEITAEEYLTKKGEYIQDKNAFLGKIKEVTRHFDEKFELVENFAEVIIQAQSILSGDDTARKRELVQSVSSNLQIYDKNLKISFKKPFSFYFKEDKIQDFNQMCGLVDDVRNYYLANPYEKPSLWLVLG